MYYQFVMSSETAGAYDIVINFTQGDAEFGLDFLSKENLQGYAEKIQAFIKKEGKGMPIRGVKIMVSGVLISSMTLAAFMHSHGAESERFSMSYLYFGSATQQEAYVERTNGSLDTVSPSYFDINADGSLKINSFSQDFINNMHAKGIKVVPFISNHWDRTAGKNMLKNGEKIAAQIAQAVETHNLDGVNVDIENVTHTEREQYTAFVAALRAAIPAHKEVSVAVAANPTGLNVGWHGSYDYTALAEHADYLMIMAYDEHWQGSEAGPVASLKFVEDSVKYALGKTTKDKVVIGLAFYGRLWSGDGKFNGDGIGASTVETVIKQYNAVVTFDHASRSTKATFTVKAGDKETKVNGKILTPGTYTLWYENEQAIAEKLALVSKYDIKGAGSWALGQENSVIWNNYSAWLDGNNFLDVNEQDWFASAAAFVKEKEIFNAGEVMFKPGQVATRAECVSWLMKAYGLKPDTNLSNNFSDVNAKADYAGYIAAAKRMGITSGIGNNKFAPEKELTREELFTLLHNTFQAMGMPVQETGDLTLDSFDDEGNVSDWAEDELDNLIRGGIVTGVGNNMLMPKRLATRAELAQVIYNLQK